MNTTETIPESVKQFIAKTNTAKALRNKSQQRLDSMTRVNPHRTHGLGLWNNPRVVVGIRVDKGLYLAFKLVARAKWGSTCNPIETFMAGVVGAYKADIERGVNPSNTVNIGEIKIERNLRERRKVTKTIETETETTESVMVKRCSVANCLSDGKLPGVAVASGVFLPRSEEYALCDLHREEFRHSRNWKVSV